MLEPESTPEGPFLIHNAAFNVLSLIYHKSKALQIYDKYAPDFQSDTQLNQLLVQIRFEEQAHIKKLKNHLVRLLQQGDKKPP